MRSKMTSRARPHLRCLLLRLLHEPFCCCSIGSTQRLCGLNFQFCPRVSGNNFHSNFSSSVISHRHDTSPSVQPVQYQGYLQTLASTVSFKDSLKPEAREKSSSESTLLLVYSASCQPCSKILRRATLSQCSYSACQGML